jgi:hypothetical protein
VRFRENLISKSVPFNLAFLNCVNVRSVQKYIVMDLINAVPGNSSVNTVQHATLDEAVFSVSSAPRPVLITDQLTRSLTHDVFFLWSAPCNNRGAVFSVRGPCREDIREYRNGNSLHLNV